MKINLEIDSVVYHIVRAIWDKYAQKRELKNIFVKPSPKYRGGSPRPPKNCPLFNSVEKWGFSPPKGG